MVSTIFHRVAAIPFLLVLFLTAQAQQVPGFHVAEENSLVRISKLNLTSPEPARFDHHGCDAVLIALADLSVGSRTRAPHAMKRGEALFIAKTEAITLSAGSGLSAILIELKHHWDSPMKSCEFPANCTREHVMEGVTISSTTSLFTNGFVTVTRHSVVRGGSLESSYYSSKGRDSIVYVPLTDALVHFGGVDELLNAGDAYFSSETSLIETEGGSKGAEWIVVRLNQPKS